MGRANHDVIKCVAVLNIAFILLGKRIVQRKNYLFFRTLKYQKM